jgi:hypothetical protein
MVAIATAKVYSIWHVDVASMKSLISFSVMLALFRMFAIPWAVQHCTTYVGDQATPDFDLMDLMIRTVDPDLLIQEDAWGHSAFDYCRKEHHGEWLEFLQKMAPIIQRRSQVTG